MLEGPTEYISEWQDGYKVYNGSYMASNGSCFTVTWTNFKNHLLKVGLTQSQETMAFGMLVTVGLLYSITCEDPYKYKFIEFTFG